MVNWREIARCFAVLRPAKWIDREALCFLRELPQSDLVLVACSGGADSVFLTLVMHTLLGPGRLRVAHFHHGLRAQDADADADFVRDMCGQLGIVCTIGHAESPLESDEASLRMARYGWLLDQYHQFGASALATGHHADDLLESQIMALFSGSGPAGLASPLPVRKFPDDHVRVRPLLPMKRLTIEKTLRSLGVPWREDASNLDERYTRNRIRQNLIPKLVEYIPQDLHAASQRSRYLMQETVEALDVWIRKLGLECADPGGFNVTPLFAQPKGLIRRSFMAWWMRHYPQCPLPAAAVDLLVEVIHAGHSGHPVSIGRLAHLEESVPCCLVISSRGQLELRPEKALAPVNWPVDCHWEALAGPLFLPDGAVLTAQQVNLSGGQTSYKNADPEREAWLGRWRTPFRVRQWQAGDRFQPLGAPGRRKLQDLFTDAKLNSEQKSRLPVILDADGSILWVPGFPPAEQAKVCHESKTALQLTYRTH